MNAAAIKINWVYTRLLRRACCDARPKTPIPPVTPVRPNDPEDSIKRATHSRCTVIDRHNSRIVMQAADYQAEPVISSRARARAREARTPRVRRARARARGVICPSGSAQNVCTRVSIFAARNNIFGTALGRPLVTKPVVPTRRQHSRRGMRYPFDRMGSPIQCYLRPSPCLYLTFPFMDGPVG